MIYEYDFLDKNRLRQMMSLFDSGKFIDGAATGPKEKHVKVYGKKGKLIEEYRFDEFGVKEQILEYQGKKKCGFKKKKTEEDTGGATMD